MKVNKVTFKNTRDGYEAHGKYGMIWPHDEEGASFGVMLTSARVANRLIGPGHTAQDEAYILIPRDRLLFWARAIGAKIARS